MANVFDKIGDIKNNVNRSSFDWSHANNVTTGIGRITPIFCEELPPNSSLKIKANLGLQFMPMMYPVQTRMKVSTSFYKIPLRTLWKDYMNWVSSPMMIRLLMFLLLSLVLTLIILVLMV